jgi:electron-transferring-flavoprotein dehydrogenase
MQQSAEGERELSVCVVEKGSEVGAHILSGAVIEPRALNELFPDWSSQGAPLSVEVTEDRFYLFGNEDSAQKIPNWLLPNTLHNTGNYIISLGSLCRWLAEQAEALGVEIFTGFSANEILYSEDGSVRGVATGDMGVGANGQQKDNFMQGVELEAAYTLFAEGCRGHLGKQLIDKYSLDSSVDPQHYAIGLKELWKVPPEQHQEGLVLHGSGWPLQSDSSGGFFLYHGADCQVSVGLVVDLNYRNPYLNPFEEFQRLKHHPLMKEVLQGGERISYGARALSKGGLNALPEMAFPGGVILGCDAGTLNVAKIKGTHTAMKSGMLAAEAVYQQFSGDSVGEDFIRNHQNLFRKSWLYDELYHTRNFGPALHKYGSIVGGAFNLLEQNLFKGKLPFTLHDERPDYQTLQPAAEAQEIIYPKPDGKISFDKLSSVFLSSTDHEEDQPCHLVLQNPEIPLQNNLPRFAEPAQRYCPAGVYEVIESEEGPRFQINAQNCLHFKTCDIKDPAQNITWVSPEGGGGPNYPNM